MTRLGLAVIILVTVSQFLQMATTKPMNRKQALLDGAALQLRMINSSVDLIQTYMRDLIPLIGFEIGQLCQYGDLVFTVTEIAVSFKHDCESPYIGTPCFIVSGNLVHPIETRGTKVACFFDIEGKPFQ